MSKAFNRIKPLDACASRLVKVALVGAAMLWAAGAQAQATAVAACPPVPQAPSQDQVQAAQRNAKDRGLLWRISKDGRDSYLYGTMHVGKLEWLFHGPKMREALAATDTLALELDPGDAAIQQEIARAMMVPGRPLSEDLRKRLAAQRAAACLPAGALEQMHPVMQVVTLSVLLARWEGLDAGFGSEAGLAQGARSVGMKVVSLETAKRQLDAIMPANKADQEAALVKSSLDQLESGLTRKVLQRMARSWEIGEAADFENYAQWCECVNTAADRDLMKRINDDRNPGLADAIDALHQGGSKVFAAVGALHTVGSSGLVKLLAARGYVVERLSFDASPKQ